MDHKHRRALFASMVASILIVGVALSACGDDEADSGAPSAAGNGIDRAFVADMIPHHKSAVQMAQIAQRRGQSSFVEKLADDIIRTQNTEITAMTSIADRLDEAGVKATSLGVAEHQMGMETDLGELRKAKPFDRAFIDMMVPHHQGAIRMARVEQEKGADGEAKQLAKNIIAAQTREINAMNIHRVDEFGSASPAGGVPTEHEKDPAMEEDGGSSMDHGSTETEAPPSARGERRQASAAQGRVAAPKRMDPQEARRRAGVLPPVSAER